MTIDMELRPEEMIALIENQIQSYRAQYQSLKLTYEIQQELMVPDTETKTVIENMARAKRSVEFLVRKIEALKGSSAPSLSA